MQTQYELLGLSRLASMEQIREALTREERRLSQLLEHPDEQRRNEARKRVVLLASVEQTLLDSTARSKYDEQLAGLSAKVSENPQPTDQSLQQLIEQSRLLLANGKFDDGLALIDRATAEHPADPSYQSQLALVCQQVAFMPWVDGPEGSTDTKYATNHEQATFAGKMIDRALALKFDDEPLRASLRKDQALVAANFKREYCGAKVQPALAFVLGALVLVWGHRSDIGMALWLVLGSALYVASWFLPAYITNREFVRGRERYDDFGWARKLRSMLPDNLFGTIAGLFLASIVFLMIPVFGIYNLYRFHWDSIQRWVRAQLGGSGAVKVPAKDAERETRA